MVVKPEAGVHFSLSSPSGILLRKMCKVVVLVSSLEMPYPVRQRVFIGEALGAVLGELVVQGESVERIVN